MEKHYQLSDPEFETQFRECSMDPILFGSHEAHLRLAYIHITKYGIDQACENLCHQIMAFDATFGKADKFHHTLTVASAKVMHHFIQKSSTENFAGLLQEFPRLKTNFKALLAQHYQTNIFSSELARVQYLEPDLLPFS